MKQKMRKGNSVTSTKERLGLFCELEKVGGKRANSSQRENAK